MQTPNPLTLFYLDEVRTLGPPCSTFTNNNNCLIFEHILNCLPQPPKIPQMSMKKTAWELLITNSIYTTLLHNYACYNITWLFHVIRVNEYLYTCKCDENKCFPTTMYEKKKKKNIINIVFSWSNDYVTTSTFEEEFLYLRSSTIPVTNIYRLDKQLFPSWRKIIIFFKTFFVLIHSLGGNVDTFGCEWNSFSQHQLIYFRQTSFLSHITQRLQTPFWRTHNIVSRATSCFDVIFSSVKDSPILYWILTPKYTHPSNNKAPSPWNRLRPEKESKTSRKWFFLDDEK